MKTFTVNVAITVFAKVRVAARSAADAETKAETTAWDFSDLELMEGQSKPEMVFRGEAKEVQLEN